jgi:hypothetical protein
MATVAGCKARSLGRDLDAVYTGNMATASP